MQFESDHRPSRLGSNWGGGSNVTKKCRGEGNNILAKWPLLKGLLFTAKIGKMVTFGDIDHQNGEVLQAD